MKRSLSLSVLLAALWLVAVTLVLPATAQSVTAPAAFYDPSVAAMINRVTQSTVYNYDAQLSGEVSVLIGGTPYTITTRNTRSGTPILKATQFAYEFMQAQGLAVSYHAWSACGTSGRNVIGTLPGLSKPNEIVLITAHIDDMPSTGIAPGADDNASGSVGVMLAAEILGDYRFERTLRFVFFTGEEQGLCGSDVYAAERYAAGDNIVAVYNMDMIAWDAVGEPTLRLHTRSSGAGYTADVAIAGVFTQTVQAYGLSGSLTPIIDADNESASDHSSFWDRGYPAILAIEDDDADFNDYYHTSNDRLANLNLPYFTAFVKASVGTAAHLAGPLNAGVVQGVVTSAGLPVAGAHLTATLDLTRGGQALSAANGAYTLFLSEGSYALTVAAYGYLSQTVHPVVAVAGVTTTQNFSLTPAMTRTVSGSIKDALTQRPISAVITIDGYPYGPIATDSVNGEYAVALLDGAAYTFHISPSVPGYFATERVVGPLTADRVENFVVQPDLAACAAPAYTFAGVRESFTITPTNWLIVNGPSGAGWRFNTSSNTNNTGGSGPYALADSDATGPGVSMDTALTSPVLDFSGLTTATLRFNTHFSYYEFGGGAEVADVDVSVAGGAWQNVWRRTADYAGPHTEVVDVSASAAGQANVRVRFHYYNAIWDGWWQVDEVSVGECRAPDSLPQWLTYLPLVLLAPAAD